MHGLLALLFLLPNASAQFPSTFNFMRPQTQPPTYVTRADIPATTRTSTPVSTSSISVLAGDILVAYAGAENDNFANPISVSGGSLTWTLEQSVGANQLGNALAYIWTATVDTNKSMTVTFTLTNGGNPYRSGGVMVFRNASGVGASAVAASTGAPSLSLTTTRPNSAIVIYTSDWNAVDGSSRTWRTSAGALTETSYNFITGAYTFYIGYHANVPTIGAYTLGLSAPAGQRFSIVAVEIKGR